MTNASFQTTPGSRDARSLAGHAPIVDISDLKPEPVSVEEMEVYHVLIEVDDRVLTPLMPPALHVPLPPMVSFVFWSCRDGSLGPFKLAQVRISTRLNARPRGLLLGSYFEGDPEAARRLRKHWAFDCQPGNITVREYHDQVVGTVEAGGRQVLRVSGRDPIAIAPDDVRDMPNCNPVRLQKADGLFPLLLQVDTESEVKQATRSIHPTLDHFDGEAWNAPGISQEYPVRALRYTCEFRVPAPRFTIDPALSTDQRSEAI